MLDLCVRLFENEALPLVNISVEGFTMFISDIRVSESGTQIILFIMVIWWRSMDIMVPVYDLLGRSLDIK